MKRFEFCFRGYDGRPNFGIVYDDNILSACERFLFRPITSADLNTTPNGNYLLLGWDMQEMISVKEVEQAELGHVFRLGDPKETEPEAPPVPTFSLGGLDLSKFITKKE